VFCGCDISLMLYWSGELTSFLEISEWGLLTCGRQCSDPLRVSMTGRLMDFGDFRLLPTSCGIQSERKGLRRITVFPLVSQPCQGLNSQPCAG
jgi:hypothetical protein